MNEIRILPPAQKYIKKIKDKILRQLFLDAITNIRNDYTIGKSKSGDLKGVYCYDIYYNNTNYEIAYTIRKNSKNEIVIIIMAGTRENFYNQLKRYI